MRPNRLLSIGALALLATLARTTPMLAASAQDQAATDVLFKDAK